MNIEGRSVARVTEKPTELPIALCLIFFSCINSVWATEPAQRSHVTIEVHNGLVLIPVLISGNQLSFLVDTGSTHSVIAKSLIEQLKLQYAGTADVQGNHGTQSLQTVRIGNIKFGDSEFNDQTFAVSYLDAVSRAVEGLGRRGARE